MITTENIHVNTGDKALNTKAVESLIYLRHNIKAIESK
jgi:hypothetical protein